MSEGRSIVEVRNLVKDVRPGFGVRRKRILHEWRRRHGVYLRSVRPALFST